MKRCKWCRKPIIENPKIDGPLWVHQDCEETAIHYADEDKPSPPGPSSYPRPKFEIKA